MRAAVVFISWFLYVHLFNFSQDFKHKMTDDYLTGFRNLQMPKHQSAFSNLGESEQLWEYVLLLLFS